MSISEIALVIQQIEGRAPTPSDPNYWAYRYRMESSRARRCPGKPINRPNPQLEANVRAYWGGLYNQEKKTW